MNIFRRLAFSGFLEDDEIIVKIFRRPFSYMFTEILFWSVLASAIAIFLWFFVPPLNGFSVWWIAAALGGIKILIIFSYWYVNTILMTTESILFIDWPKLFEKSNQRLDFSNLDAVSIKKKGVHSFFMNFGTLIFDKTGGGDSIQIENMNRPSRVVRIIEAYKEQKLDEKNFTEESALKDLLSQLVRTHVDDNGQPERLSDEAVRPELRSERLKLQKSKLQKSKKEFFQRKKKRFESQTIEIEKTFDDEGGIEIDLTEKD